MQCAILIHLISSAVVEAGPFQLWRIMEVQLASAVLAEEEAVQRPLVSVLPGTTPFLAYLPCGLPGFFIDDGLLRILCEDPLALWKLNNLLAFVGELRIAVADGMPAVFLPVENGNYCCHPPSFWYIFAVQVFILLLAGHTDFQPMPVWWINTLLIQPKDDLSHGHP